MTISGNSSSSTSSVSKEAIRASMCCLASFATEMWPLQYALLRSCRLSKTVPSRQLQFLVPERPPLEDAFSEGVADPWRAR